MRTVGDGVVEFAGEQNGFGNVVIVKHNNSDQTFYAHLSRIDVRPGQSVQQGQNIGAVGSTGWATGPHLHFEFRVNGMHHDPMEMAKHSEAAAAVGASPARVRPRLPAPCAPSWPPPPPQSWPAPTDPRGRRRRGPNIAA